MLGGWSTIPYTCARMFQGLSPLVFFSPVLLCTPGGRRHVYGAFMPRSIIRQRYCTRRPCRVRKLPSLHTPTRTGALGTLSHNFSVRGKRALPSSPLHPSSALKSRKRMRIDFSAEGLIVCIPASILSSDCRSISFGCRITCTFHGNK